ncbi:hypothetical protein FBT96_07355 [Rhodobacter capsulatus]|uniref:Type VI secretion system protein VasI n=1 Tax=Rhodobacter capsulatus TaxID=1061 RepID=A0A4V6WQX8_RHOCA|nr:type VI secretion system-associated protein TagO [Rhodobacter capsulatus]TKD21962.1 hypothetical protein FBT96_07355 [Rhodobacter capsulatus]
MKYKVTSRIFSVLTAYSFACSASYADDAELISEAKKCSALDGAGFRMTCYDSIFKGNGKALLPVPAPEATPEPQAQGTEGEEIIDLRTEVSPGAQWHYSEKRSELDGRKDVWLSNESINTHSNQIGTPEHATLWLRCQGNTTSVILSFNSYISDNQSVPYRFDEGSVQKIGMVTAAGGEGLGLWSGGKSIPFIKSIFGKSKLVISFNSYSSRNIEFSFDVSGLRDRIDNLAAACKWSP